MKLAVRAFALLVVLAGAVAASSSSTTHVFASHQSATASGPGPTCIPGVTCPK